LRPRQRLLQAGMLPQRRRRRRPRRGLRAGGRRLRRDPPPELRDGSTWCAVSRYIGRRLPVGTARAQICCAAVRAPLKLRTQVTCAREQWCEDDNRHRKQGLPRRSTVSVDVSRPGSAYLPLLARRLPGSACWHAPRHREAHCQQRSRPTKALRPPVAAHQRSERGPDSRVQTAFSARRQFWRTRGARHQPTNLRRAAQVYNARALLNRVLVR
jgi:hypothetical protein